MQLKITKAFLGLLIATWMLGCSSTDSSGSAKGKTSGCCAKAMTIRGYIPQCCIDGMATGAGCCKKGLAPETPDAERPECCKTALAKLEKMPPCCHTAMTGGEVSPCCKGMMEKIQSE